MSLSTHSLDPLASRRQPAQRLHHHHPRPNTLRVSNYRAHRGGSSQAKEPTVHPAARMGVGVRWWRCYSCVQCPTPPSFAASQSALTITSPHRQASPRRSYKPARSNYGDHSPAEKEARSERLQLQAAPSHQAPRWGGRVPHGGAGSCGPSQNVHSETHASRRITPTPSQRAQKRWLSGWPRPPLPDPHLDSRRAHCPSVVCRR